MDTNCKKIDVGCGQCGHCDKEDEEREVFIPEVEVTLLKYKTPQTVEYLTPLELSQRPGGGSILVSKKGTFDSIEDVLDRTLTAEEVLNEILPPKEWIIGGKKWIQYVSTVPAKRNDIIHLQEMLDRRLKEEKAGELGIDSKRRDLYTQFFDELIRQVTLESSERGLLLYRVKREFLETIQEYESIYKSAIGFGIRKRMTDELGNDDLEQIIYELPTKIDGLKTDIENIKKKIQETIQAAKEARIELLGGRQADIKTMKESNSSLKAEIWKAMNPKSY